MDTDPTCLGEGTKLMPIPDLGSHLGTPPLPTASLLYRAKTGHPKAVFSLSLGVTEVVENISNGEEAYSLSSRQFIR